MKHGKTSPSHEMTGLQSKQRSTCSATKPGKACGCRARRRVWPHGSRVDNLRARDRGPTLAQEETSFENGTRPVERMSRGNAGVGQQMTKG